MELFTTLGDLDHRRVLCTAIAVLALLFILLAFKSRAAVKYYVKYYSFLVACALTGSMSFFALLLKPGDSGNFSYGKLVYRLTRINKWFGVEIKIKNEHILRETNKPFVIMANHQSSLDFFVILQIGPDRTATVAKRELLFAPIFGQIIWLAGTIFIDRKAGASIDAMRKTAQEVKRTNTNIWIFPEGTRRQIDDFLPFKKGGFHLAIQAQIPIVPVVIGNYRNILDRKNRIFDTGTIHVEVLDPIYTDGVSKEDVAAITEKCRTTMLAAFEKDFSSRANDFQNLIPLERSKIQ